MKAVGVRELKNRLSEYLRAVRQGEQILITDRGQVIAELRQPTAYSDQGDLAPALASMVRERTLEVGLPNRAEAYPAQPRRVPDGTAGRVLGELRDER
jgi:antitoxin (DNA-binding transcriptional repressor) of toxin-antitoxin stability system